MTDYDGRFSVGCAQNCQAGECGHPRTSIGCGGCCGCRGECVAGWEEQQEEERAELEYGAS